MRTFGREQIFTTTNEINAENVLNEVNLALAIHIENVQHEDYLYRYMKGKQPILARKKTVRPEINNKIVVNHATEIVTFKDGYFLPEPAFYKSRTDKANSTEINKLNEYLYQSGKHMADNQAVHYFHTMGLGNIYVYSSNDKVAPVKACALDPRQSFVVYSRRPGYEPMFGVNMVTVGDRLMFDVFTKNEIFHLIGTGEKTKKNNAVVSYANAITDIEPNLIGEIPIIEYQYDANRMGAFEPVVSMLDAINEITSDAQNGIEQFVQSLMIFYNCELGDDADGNPLTPAYIREAGAIFLKSIGQDKADLKILTEQLDQSQTQVLKEDLYKQVLHIVGMPASGESGGGTSDNVGAVIWRSGWYQAETYAKNTEDLFREANRRFDRCFLNILKAKTDIQLELGEFELHFPRNDTVNIVTKTQAALNMKELGFAPEIAFSRSGVSNDPVADVEQSRKYIKLKWEDNANKGTSPVADGAGIIGKQDVGSEDGKGKADDSGTGAEKDNLQR